MIVQVLSAGIPLGYFVLAVCFVNVPTHEIQRVPEILPAGATIARGSLILGPGSIEGLAITECTADSTIWDEAQKVFSWWPGVMDKARFLLHHCHGDMYWYAPFLFHFERVSMPPSFFIEDRTDIGCIGRLSVASTS